MMQKRLITVAFAAMTLAAFGRQSAVDSQRETLSKDHKIIYFGGGSDGAASQASDSVRKMIDSFYYEQFRHFQDPAAPYFLFMSRDAKLAMGIGGCVRMRGWYEWGGEIPANGFVPALIPMSPDPTKMRRFATTPAGTALFYRVIGRTNGIRYQLYIECNFNGWQSRDFHLKKAYAIVNDWTIGYANSTFSDPSALPPTVDAQGPNNKILNSNVLVRWLKTFRNRWTVAASVETPTQQMDIKSDMTAKCDEWMPDFAAFLQYEWGRSSHVRLAGILRTLTYRDISARKNYTKPGYGVQLSAVCHPAYPLTLYGTVNYGRGIASLGGDMMVGGYDLVPLPGAPGRLYAPQSLGWCAAVQYNILDNLFVSTTFGQSVYMPDHPEAGSNYKYGLYSATNVFWNLTPRIQIGAEFNIGKRRDIDGRQRWARRAEAMCQFSF